MNEFLAAFDLPDWRPISSDVTSAYSATVIVEWARVKVKFTFDRFDYWIDVAAPSEPDEWLYLPYVLDAGESGGDRMGWSVAKNLDELFQTAEELKRNWAVVQLYLARDAYANTKRRVRAIEQRLGQ